MRAHIRAGWNARTLPDPETTDRDETMTAHISAHGRLARDPQQRETKAGKPMTLASIACDVSAHNAEGDQETLTGKRHADVLRDIRAMIAQVHDFEDNAELRYQQIQGVIVEADPQTKRTAAIHLDKDHTLTLLTGYDAKARHCVVKRWQELMWLSLMAFGDQAAVLARCKAGEAVSVIGRLTRSRYLKDGVERESWSCLIDGLLTTRSARPGQRSAKAA